MYAIRSYYEVRGKTDYEIVAKEIADEFRKNDLQVLEQGKSMQVEEQVSHNGEIHTYLSVKFPVYDDAGNVNGVCGISTDITAVKKAQDQLRRLSGRIIVITSYSIHYTKLYEKFLLALSACRRYGCT